MKNHTRLNGQICPREFDWFVGMDVDTHHYAITIMNREGEKQSWTMPPKAEGLIQRLQRVCGDLTRIAAVYEAGPTGFGLFDAFVQAGIACLVVAPTSLPVSRTQDVKTNRLDSERLARWLMGGQLTGIRVPSAAYRVLRTKVANRQRLQKAVGATKNRIRAMLHQYGVPFPQIGRTAWSRARVQALRDLEVAPGLRDELDALLEELVFFQRQVQTTTRRIRAWCQQHPELSDSLRYVCSLPGVGLVVGSTLLARIGDWRGLRRVEELARFCGLTPTEHSSGDRVVRGAITPFANGSLRCVLIEAAWCAVRRDPELRAVYERLKARRGAHKAIVAVARHLSARVYAVLKERRLYEVRS
ncbi:MAG: IS110 family transposase [Fimbriimonadia bacterium]|nr:IS110 family transposase [Fimbriimonadia bacterium]